MESSLLALGVAGRPVFHSLSPRIFRALFAASGRAGVYLRLASRTAEEALLSMEELGLEALNLTSPFKEALVSRLEELSPRAARLGAVNFVRRLGGGGRRGDSTDGAGLLGALAERGFDPRGRSCLLIGAGGAGRAAALALGEAGALLRVANRGAERGRLAAELGGGTWAPLEELPRLAAGAELIVSTLSPEHLPEPSLWLPPGRLVLDADYRRGLLAEAQLRLGPPPLRGERWLLHQALPCWEALLGRPASGEEGRAAARALESVLEAPRRRPAIALVGPMGAGKSRVGRLLAGLLGLPFLDLDAQVEAGAGRSVAEIFATEGEGGFRARERRAFEAAASRGPLVLAAGGGLVVDSANRALLATSFETVLLHLPPEAAARRVGGEGGRPLLAGGGAAERLAALWAARRPAYLSCADLVLRSAETGPEELAERIRDEMR